MTHPSDHRRGHGEGHDAHKRDRVILDRVLGRIPRRCDEDGAAQSKLPLSSATNPSREASIK